MYDNIDFNLTKEKTNNIDLLNITPQYLTNISNIGQNQFGEYVTGYLDSLKISITENRVKIYDSSICKYYLGNNFQTLTKGDTKRVIQKISDCLHLPFDHAIITRIDAAHNLIMQFDEKLYYNYLGEAPFYNRLPQNNGLYYNTQIRQLVFYGKEKEQKDKKQTIPDMYKGKHILRYEIRFKKRLQNQFNQFEITSKLLWNDEFYKSIVSKWKKEYLNINKLKSKLINMKPTGSTKELNNYLACFGVLEIGQPKILEVIKEWQISDLITKKQAKDLRENIKKLCQIKPNEQNNDLIQELNKKINEAARYL